MAHYIDADKLRAEIKRKKKKNDTDLDNGCNEDQCEGYEIALYEILSFLDSLQEPSLPSNLDEAAFSYENDLWESGFKECGYSPEEVSDAFKARAEWMAGSGVKAHCIESSNPVSESPDVRLHLITLLYKENENIPYVQGGDDIDIIIRKKSL